METMGQRVRYLIRKNHTTAREVAERLQLPPTTLSNIVNDKFEPGIFKVKRLAEFFNVDLHWLITGKTFTEQLAEFNSSLSAENKFREDGADEFFHEQFGKLLRELKPEHRKVLNSLLFALHKLALHLSTLD